MQHNLSYVACRRAAVLGSDPPVPELPDVVFASPPCQGSSPASSPWEDLVASSVWNPEILRAALRQTLQRALAAAHGHAPQPLLVLLVGPYSANGALVNVVRRIAVALRMEPHLSMGGAPRSTPLTRLVTWRVAACATDLEVAAVLEEVKLGTNLITAETMCVLTHGADPREEITSPTFLLDVLLWPWSSSRGEARNRRRSSTRAITADSSNSDAWPLPEGWRWCTPNQNVDGEDDGWYAAGPTFDVWLQRGTGRPRVPPDCPTSTIIPRDVCRSIRARNRARAAENTTSGDSTS